MKFYPVPDAFRANLDQNNYLTVAQQLYDLQMLNVIPQNIGCFAGEYDWITKTQTGPQKNTLKYFKPWRDNAAIWKPAMSAFDYLAFAGMGLANGSDAFHQNLGNVLSAGVMRFYADYKEHFPTIPMLEALSLNAQEAKSLDLAQRLNCLSWPIGILQDDPSGPNGKRWSFPSNMALRFAPGSMAQIEVFFYEDFVKEFGPAGSKPAIGLSDSELVGAVRSLLSANLPDTDTAKFIRQMVK